MRCTLVSLVVFGISATVFGFDRPAATRSTRSMAMGRNGMVCASQTLAAEAGAVAHMNEDHAEALRLYATKLLGLADGDWRMTGADPEGIDLRMGATRARLDFPERVTTAAGLRQTLVDLAREARSRT